MNHDNRRDFLGSYIKEVDWLVVTPALIVVLGIVTYCMKNTTQYYKIFFELYNYRNDIKKLSQVAKPFYTFLPLTILLLLCYLF